MGGYGEALRALFALLILTDLSTFWVAESANDYWCVAPSTIRVAQDEPCTSATLAQYASDKVEWNAMLGERESAQLVLSSPLTAGSFVMEFSDLMTSHNDVIPASSFSYKQVMYVFCKNSTLTQSNVSRWVADPLLAGNGTGGMFPVERGSTQPVWVSVDVPRHAAPGDYHGTATFMLTLEKGQMTDVVPIHLHVWNLTVPDLASSTFTMTYSFDGLAKAYYGGNVSILNEFHAMLTDYRMPPDALYRGEPITPVDATYLVSTGTEWFNLISITTVIVQLMHPGHVWTEDPWKAVLYGRGPYEDGFAATPADCPIPANVSDDILTKALGYLAPAVERAEKMGYLDQTYVYGFDEAPLVCLGTLRRVYGAIKAKWPRVHTTAVLNWHPSGVPVDLPLDTWVLEYDIWDHPSNESQVHSSAKAFLAHSPTRRLFFYHCIAPASRQQLNTFIDRPLMEARLMYLYGAATSSLVSGWLYYAVNDWEPIKGSAMFVTRVNGSARSEFNVEHSFGSPDRFGNGDGLFIYPGQAGPVASVRMEALRDAAEDVELFRMVPTEKAESFVQKLVRSSRDFTLDPLLLESTRIAVANAALAARERQA